MRARSVFVVLAPAAEVAAVWLWLARGSAIAGRFVTFYWWFVIATIFLCTCVIVVGCLVAKKPIPRPKPFPWLLKWSSRLVPSVRIAAQIALGYSALAVFSMCVWLLWYLMYEVCFETPAKTEEGA